MIGVQVKDQLSSAAEPRDWRQVWLFVQKKFVDLGQAEVWKNCYEMVGFGGYDMHVELRVMPLIGNNAVVQGGAGSPPGNSPPARGRSRGRPPLKRM